MAQKAGLSQTQTITQIQKLSPQQIQFIKLLQIPTAELEARIEEELANNPALEEVREDYRKDEKEEANEEREIDSLKEETYDEYDSSYEDSYESYDNSYDDYDGDSSEDSNYTENYDNVEYYDNSQDINIDDYLNDDYTGYKMYGDGNEREEEKEIPIATYETLNEKLETQLGFLGLTETQKKIGKHIIGMLDNDGYLRRSIESITNDLLFYENIETTPEEVESILKKIHHFDPPGIGARNLKECLLIQLRRKENNPYSRIAIKVLENCFEEFTKKHYDKIQRKLGISSEELKGAIKCILKLNPKPGEASGNELVNSHYIIPDFILTNNNGKLELTLNAKNAPELRINQTYAEMLDTYSKSNKKDKAIRETITFVKQKLDAAKWFIDAIKQRQQTLLKTMNAIIEYQYEFFLEGDESKFKPMILKDIADKIGMDISTISRVANSKSIQTEFGIYPLKYFFSEGISTETGEDVSSREVKSILKELVENEDKRKPLSDDKLEKLLKSRGYQIARRTVAKYREQLNIPVARLRKKL
ncbi:MAG: RNA polymerase factor sigma-54 [Microscillaceae bacterium]|nr:RNA polymerase factor sigma-54 [Microscillaceae bacterium]MDW8461910.1 RNA polymerase factor sigma-54 [Cytophagales bacterium]